MIHERFLTEWGARHAMFEKFNGTPLWVIKLLTMQRVEYQADGPLTQLARDVLGLGDVSGLAQRANEEKSGLPIDPCPPRLHQTAGCRYDPGRGRRHKPRLRSLEPSPDRSAVTCAVVVLLAIAGRRTRRRRRRAGLRWARCAGRRPARRRSSDRRRGARRRSRTRGTARASVSSGTPPRPSSQSRPANRSAPAGVARLAKRSCCRPSTLTPKRRVRRMRDHVSELRDGQNETRGGSSETDVSEFTISPAGSPSGAAVTNATPVANLPSASRNERASGAGAAGAGAASAISVERRSASPSATLAEVVVGAVGAERVHEGAGLDVAVGARERAAVDVAGAAREGERAVDDAGGRLVDERLGGLRLGEQRAELARRCRRTPGWRRGARRSARPRATGRRARRRGRRRCRPPACAGARRR